MPRLKFVVDCLAYAGQPDSQRQQAVMQFVSSELGVPIQDVDFAEVAIADAAGGLGSVQPALVVYRTLDLGDDAAHRELVLRIGAIAQAIHLYVVRVVVQQLASYVAHGIAAGLASGASLGGGSGAQEKTSESQVLGVLLGAALGALIGGAIGASIARDGPVLGIWQRDAAGIWRYTATERIVSAIDGPLLAQR